MDYSSFNYNIEEANAELAKFSSWSFTTVEGHASNVIRINNPKTDIDKMDLENKENTISSSSLTSSDSSDSSNIIMETDPSTLLEVIDNKNKEISKLKNLNYNQKLQLNYYLKKGLLCDNVPSFAHTVNINVPEEYDSIHFALARFMKINNGKSRIMRTFEKLNNLESKTSHLLKRQENLLRKVTLDVLSANAEQSLNKNENDTTKTNEQQFASYAAQLDIFSKILATTLSIKRELEMIKTYSRRLIAIEEERNSLVDYIYQLPVEQRLNGNYLLAVERDKAKLCIEIANIRRDQKLLKEKLSNLNHEEEYLKATAKEIKAKSLKMKEDQDIKALEEKNQLQIQLEKLQKENQQLQEKIQLQQQTIQNHLNNESKWIETEGKYRALEKQLEMLTHQKHEQENELLRLHKMEVDYNELLHTNEVLKKKLVEQRQLEDEVNELKQKLRKLENVKEDRDNLREQLCDAYSMRLFSSLIDANPRLEGFGPISQNYVKSLCDRLARMKAVEMGQKETSGQFQSLTKTLLQHDNQIKNLEGLLNYYGNHKKFRNSPDLNRNQQNDTYFSRLAQELVEKMNSKSTNDHDTNSRTCIPPKCSSTEALKSVFGLDKVCHSSKIIETGQLLSKINSNIESLTETTRVFCPKNNHHAMIDSNTNLSSSSLEINNEKDPNNNNNKNIDISTNLKSKLPVRASVHKLRSGDRERTEQDVNPNEEDFAKLNELCSGDLPANEATLNGKVCNDNRIDQIVTQAYHNAEDAFEFYLTFEIDQSTADADKTIREKNKQKNTPRVKLGDIKKYFQNNFQDTSRIN